MHIKYSHYERLLIEKLNRGDSDAFSEIFRAYYKDLLMFAFSFLKELPGSEEIVQDTFLKLWEDRAKIDIKSSLKSILLKSVQNRCIDWYRHKKIIRNHADSALINEPIFDFNTDNYILWSELNGLVESAVLRMPAKSREAFEMNRNEGLKYNEIAEKLSVSVRTVEVRISKALEILRNELKDFM